MSTASEIVAKIDAYFNSRDDPSVQDYMIGGKRLTRYSIRDLLELRREYSQIAGESETGGGVNLVQF